MFLLNAEKNKLTVAQRESVTSGSVNVYQVRFDFSPCWTGMDKIAVFRAGTVSRSVPLGDTGRCTIPWEVLETPNLPLMAGVYGTRDSEVVLPTVWANLGTILEGAAPGEDARPPTPDLWEQELAGKGDKLDYTAEGELGLYAGDKLLSSVPVSGGGGDGSITDHRLLSHRDAEGQHPVSAITGLPEALERIPEPVEPLTNSDLEAILK